MSLLGTLRDRTRRHHEAIERQFGLFDRSWTAVRYQALLERFLGYYEPLETRIELAADWKALDFDWSRRRKVPLLECDLRSFGESQAALGGLPRCHDLPEVCGLSQALGCLYVLEGATLGGQVVVRHLASIPGLEDLRHSFFSSYGDQVGSKWMAFGEFLSDRGGGDGEIIVEAACQTFATLGRWLSDETSTRTARE